MKTLPSHDDETEALDAALAASQLSSKEPSFKELYADSWAHMTYDLRPGPNIFDCLEKVSSTASPVAGGRNSAVTNGGRGDETGRLQENSNCHGRASGCTQDSDRHADAVARGQEGTAGEPPESTSCPARSANSGHDEDSNCAGARGDALREPANRLQLPADLAAERMLHSIDSLNEQAATQVADDRKRSKGKPALLASLQSGLAERVAAGQKKKIHNVFKQNSGGEFQAGNLEKAGTRLTSPETSRVNQEAREHLPNASVCKPSPSSQHRHIKFYSAFLLGSTSENYAATTAVVMEQQQNPRSLDGRVAGLKYNGCAATSQGGSDNDWEVPDERVFSESPLLSVEMNESVADSFSLNNAHPVRRTHSTAAAARRRTSNPSLRRRRSLAGSEESKEQQRGPEAAESPAEVHRPIESSSEPRDCRDAVSATLDSQKQPLLAAQQERKFWRPPVPKINLGLRPSGGFLERFAPRMSTGQAKVDSRNFRDITTSQVVNKFAPTLRRTVEVQKSKPSKKVGKRSQVFLPGCCDGALSSGQDSTDESRVGRPSGGNGASSSFLPPSQEERHSVDGSRQIEPKDGKTRNLFCHDAHSTAKRHQLETGRTSAPLCRVCLGGVEKSEVSSDASRKTRGYQRVLMRNSSFSFSSVSGGLALLEPTSPQSLSAAAQFAAATPSRRQQGSVEARDAVFGGAAEAFSCVSCRNRERLLNDSKLGQYSAETPRALESFSAATMSYHGHFSLNADASLRQSPAHKSGSGLCKFLSPSTPGKKSLLSYHEDSFQTENAGDLLTNRSHRATKPIFMPVSVHARQQQQHRRSEDLSSSRQEEDGAGTARESGDNEVSRSVGLQRSERFAKFLNTSSARKRSPPLQSRSLNAPDGTTCNSSSLAAMDSCSHEEWLSQSCVHSLTKHFHSDGENDGQTTPLLLVDPHHHGALKVKNASSLHIMTDQPDKQPEKSLLETDVLSGTCCVRTKDIWTTFMTAEPCGSREPSTVTHRVQVKGQLSGSIITFSANPGDTTTDRNPLRPEGLLLVNAALDVPVDLIRELGEISVTVVYVCVNSEGSQNNENDDAVVESHSFTDFYQHVGVLDGLLLTRRTFALLLKQDRCPPESALIVATVALTRSNTLSSQAFFRQLGSFYKDMKSPRCNMICPDVIIMCGTSKIVCSRFVLCARSAVFRSTLRDSLKRAIYVRGVRPFILEQLLEFIHTNSCGLLKVAEPPEDDLLELFEVAKKYKVEPLQDCLCAILSALSAARF